MRDWRDDYHRQQQMIERGRFARLSFALSVMQKRLQI